MANLNDAVLAFVTLDTAKQDEVLRRVGLETTVGDRLLGALRNVPERFDALVAFSTLDIVQ